MDTTAPPKRGAGRPTDGHPRKNLCIYVREDAIAEFQRKAKEKGLKQAEYFNAEFSPATEGASQP